LKIGINISLTNPILPGAGGNGETFFLITGDNEPLITGDGDFLVHV